MADDNLPAKFHLDPFSRFAGIHVSVQFGAKTQRWVTLGENLGEKGLIAVNLRWVGEGWGYHMEETRRWYLFWFEHSPRVSQTDRQTCL